MKPKKPSAVKASEETTAAATTAASQASNEATPHDPPAVPQTNSDNQPWPYGSAKPAVKTFDEDPDGEVL